MTEFTEADEEFLPMAKELFEMHKNKLGLTVDPSLVMFLRSDTKMKAFAYCKSVKNEYELLTDKKFFIVIVNKFFNRLKSETEKRYVLLHEMKHLNVNEDGRYNLLDHNLKEFRELLLNPSWNLLLVNNGKEEDKPIEGEVKIGLDFDFNNKDKVKEFNQKIKEKDSEEENSIITENNEVIAQRQEENMV